MKQLIYNYYIEEKRDYENANILITDNIYIIKDKKIEIATIRKIKELKYFYFMIDFSEKKLNIKSARKIIKQIKKISGLIEKNKKQVGLKKEEKIILGNIIGIEQQYANDILVAITIPLIENKIDKYNYLYDNICWYLDNEFKTKNLCEFKNDKCIGVSKNSKNCAGCCIHFPDKRFGGIYQSPKKMVVCEYLDTTSNKKGCTTKCIMCKMITCSAVRKKGSKFNVWNVLLLCYYFNLLQKWIVISSAFTKKEVILEKICKVSLK